MKPNELAKLTFHEFNKMIEGYNYRQEQDNYRQEQEWYKIRWTTWHLGVLIRTEEYPTFDKFVKPSKQKTVNASPMSNDEMYKQVERLNQIFGGTIVAGGEQMCN